MTERNHPGSRIPCGSEPAREGVQSVNIIVN